MDFVLLRERVTQHADVEAGLARHIENDRFFPHEQIARRRNFRRRCFGDDDSAVPVCITLEPIRPAKSLSKKVTA